MTAPMRTGLPVLVVLALLVALAACAPAAAPPAAKPSAAPTSAASAAQPTGPAPSGSGAVAPTSAAAAASAPAPVKLRVATIRVTSDIGMYAAQDKGYFKDQGLDVEFVDFTSPLEIVPALAARQLDVGLG